MLADCIYFDTLKFPSSKFVFCSVLLPNITILVILVILGDII